MHWSHQPPSLERIIGIATLNAASQHIIATKNPYKKVEENLLDYLKIKNQTRVTFIGFIKPMIKSVMSKTKFIKIIDNNPMIEKIYSNVSI